MEKLKRYSVIDSSHFEDLIVDIFNQRDTTNSYFLFGRNGQVQNSIDVISTETKTAIQCKYKHLKENTNKNRKAIKREIVDEVSNFQKSGIDATHFIYATTYEHDAEIQKFCMEYQTQNELPFVLSYFGWQEIEKIIVKNEWIIRKHFPQLLFEQNHVEISRVDIDNANCSWDKDPDNEYTFWNSINNKSPFPIFNFWFFNNSAHDILLCDIKLKIRELRDAFQGGPVQPIYKIESSSEFRIIVEGTRDFYKPEIFEPLGIVAKKPFRFQVQVFNKFNDIYLSMQGRFLLYFEFEFNNNVRLISPALYLNTNNEIDDSRSYFDCFM